MSGLLRRVGRWPRRLLVGIAALLVVGTLLRLLRFEPDLPRVTLALALVLAVGWLVADVLDAPGPVWTVTGREATRSPGVDPGLASYLRILEHHRRAPEPGPGLRDRLAGLAADRLERHGVRLSEPAARDLLGADLAAALSGPPRRLEPAELAAFLDRLEAL